MSTGKILMIAGGAAAGVFILVVMALVGVHLLTSFVNGKVAVVKIEGVIIDPMPTLGDLRDVEKDSSVDAVIVRIDSPGGSVAASQEIFYAIRDLAKVKPTVASMGDVAASGGYYVALGAQEIIASPGTVTGSIGVRMEHVEMDKLLDWAKIKRETIKSGHFKDINSANRPMTAEERALLESTLRDMHEQFKDDVFVARRMTDKKALDKIADGRWFSGKEALAQGLVDTLGGFNTALESVKKLANLGSDPKIKYMKKKEPWLVRYLFGDMSGIIEKGLITGLRVVYLW